MDGKEGKVQPAQPTQIAKPLDLNITLVERPNNKLLVDFGKSISWIELAPDQAVALGKFLFEKGQAMIKKAQGAKP